jgi:TonB family protein
LVGVAILLIKLIKDVLFIKRLIKESKKIERDDDIIIAVHRQNISPFSWKNYIVISETDYKKGFDIVIAHEESHIKMKHSLDLVLVQLYSIITWYNPFIWLLKRELSITHEYEADSLVLDRGYNLHEYQERIVEEAIGFKINTLTNNFNICSTKKRLKMMKKKRTSKWTILKDLYLILTLALMSIVFCECSTLKKMAKENQEVLMKVDDMPEFPGGTAELMQFLSRTIVYPSTAKENKIQDRVMVTFIVRKDGSISDVKAKGEYPILNEEAERVFKSMPKWIPGKHEGKAVNVQITFPISFRLND